MWQLCLSPRKEALSERGPLVVFPGKTFKTWSPLPEFLSHHTQGHFNENSKVQAKRIELLLILQQCRHLIPRPSGVIIVCLQSTAKQTEEGSVGHRRRLVSNPYFYADVLFWSPKTQWPIPSLSPTFFPTPQDDAVLAVHLSEFTDSLAFCY